KRRAHSGAPARRPGTARECRRLAARNVMLHNLRSHIYLGSICAYAHSAIATIRKGAKMEFKGKVALITGGGGGIGKATARRFLEEGASVVLSSRRREVLEVAQSEIDPCGERTAIVAGDASNPHTAEQLVASAVERWGGVDVVI